jgi:quercetin 2,3-dioxygenase
MTASVLEVQPLGFPWVTADPFLFCVHHDDAYPAGDAGMGPVASLEGRKLGMDFEGKDGWRMYHGEVVPGFPQHPHRGFETVTIVRRGIIDHSDSLGAAARFGAGDVQWLTAGGGIVHSEMFPLLEREQPNPLELFQIWLNLPSSDKMVEPHFAMLWNQDIPVHRHSDGAGRKTDVTVIAGELAALRAPSPPPRSWAARKDTDVAIYTIRMDPGATYELAAAASAETSRVLYFFRGTSLRVGEHLQRSRAALAVDPTQALELESGDTETEILVLQGRPIAEPVVQHGPFVMNTRAEIQQAMMDYQRTRFGGWPWPKDDPVHAREEGRFARHADGRVERR